MQQGFYCTKCGSPVPFGARFCGNCRAELVAGTQQQEGWEAPTLSGTTLKNYYEILQTSPNAEPSVIVAAYRRLAQTYHPDKAKSPMVSGRMTDINEAYEVLSDPHRRAAYDRTFKSTFESANVVTEETTQEDIIIALVRFAAEKAAEGKKRSEVADELTRQGVPYDIAAEVVNKVFEYRSELKRKEGGKSIGCGLLMLLVGGIITGVTYLFALEVGGTYFVTTGLFIVGGITLLVGFFRWITS